MQRSHDFAPAKPGTFGGSFDGKRPARATEGGR